VSESPQATAPAWTLSPSSGSGIPSMIAGAFFFSLMSALVKIGGARFPTMELVFIRSVVVLLISGSTLLIRREGFRGVEPRLLTLRGLLGFVALSSFYYGVVHLPLAEATVIQYTNPIWTALIAAVVLGEGVRRRQLGLALLSLGGVVLIARPDLLLGGGGGLPPGAVAIALTGSVFSAAAYVVVRRLRREPTMRIVLHFAIWSTVLSLPTVLLGGWVRPAGIEWLLLLGIGISTHLGQVFLTRGLAREPAGKAMSIAYLQVVFALVWGILLFTEVPDLWAIGGGVVILGSTAAVARTPRMARHEQR